MFTSKIRHQSVSLQTDVPPGRLLPRALDTITAFTHPITEDAGRGGKPRKIYHLANCSLSLPQVCSNLLPEEMQPPGQAPLKPFTIFQTLYTGLPVAKSTSEKTRTGIPNPCKDCAHTIRVGKTLTRIHLCPFRYPGTRPGTFSLRSIKPSVNKKQS